MTDERNVLLRCYLAAQFTSPAVGPLPCRRAYQQARLAGLIEWRNGWRLTATGQTKLGQVTLAQASAEFDCRDCRYLQGHVSWWCKNDRAIAQHNSAIPGRTTCDFWAAAERE